MAVTGRNLVILLNCGKYCCFFIIKSKGRNYMTLYSKNAEIRQYIIIFYTKLNEE